MRMAEREASAARARETRRVANTSPPARDPPDKEVVLNADLRRRATSAKSETKIFSEEVRRARQGAALDKLPGLGSVGGPNLPLGFNGQRLQRKR